MSVETTGVPQSMASTWTLAKQSVRLGRANTSHSGVEGRQLAPVAQQPDECDAVRVRLDQRPARS